MKKLLYTASTDIHLINFHLPYLKWFKDQGFEVHVACNGTQIIPFADKYFNLPFERSPFGLKNWRVYQQLKEIIDANNYSIIHCHTPTCSVLTRLAAIRARKNGTKVLYTAHGFHFYSGAPIKNWITFYPIEIILSHVTDGIITMNREDFNTLQRRIFKSNGKHFIDGIGINPARLVNSEVDTQLIKRSLGISENDIVVIYIAEFNKRKNHQFIFRHLDTVFKKVPNLVVLFAGGFSTEKNSMELLAKEKGFLEKIRFLGYQPEIGKFISIADIGISSSRAEGLPIGIAELMFSKLPVVVSRIRGHVELVEHGTTGYLFQLTDNEGFTQALVNLAESKEFRRCIGERASISMNKFLVESAVKQMGNIYRKYI